MFELILIFCLLFIIITGAGVAHKLSQRIESLESLSVEIKLLVEQHKEIIEVLKQVRRSRKPKDN